MASMGVIRGSSYYTFVDAPSWTSAELNANKIGGHLITINDLSEYKWAQDNLWTRDNLQSEGRAGNSWSYVGFNDKNSEGRYEWAGNESTSWSPATDLIHPQNWYLQKMHFGSWDYGLQPPDSGWYETAYDSRIGTFKNRGTIVLMDDHASFYRRHGTPIVGAAEVPLSYFSISDAEVEEGEKGKIKILRTGGTSTEQTLILVTSDGSAVAGDDYKKKTKTIAFAAGETS